MGKGGERASLLALIESFYNCGKPVAAVCHSPAVFHRVMFEGVPLVKGKRVTGFTNGEEEAVHCWMIQALVGCFVTLNVQDASTIMADDEEAVEHAECDRWHSKEIHGCNGFPMVSKKGLLFRQPHGS